METALITGANRGIGLELTKQLLSAGYRVLATCREPKSAEELIALAHHASLEVLSLDVTSANSTDNLRKALNGQTLDLLFNNAGVSGGSAQALDCTDYSAWARTLEVNTLSPFRTTTALLDSLRRSKHPRVITLSSQMGSLNRKSPGMFAYRSSKAALNKVMQVLAHELEGEGIIVCPVHPGWVRTDMGGPEADISVEESVSGILKLASSLTMQESGRFWTWDGNEHPW